jgi:hemolysin activation/secretion protein
MMTRGHLSVSAGAALAGLMVSVLGASAQVRAPVERNLPPDVTDGRADLRMTPPVLTSEADKTPLGVALRGIHLAGPKDPIDASSSPGIRIGAIDGLPPAPLEQALAPFLGQPVSRKLIADIQVAVARVYRGAGYPFMSVTVPPQEITGGVLTFRVVEFRTGTVVVQGGDASLAHRLRTGPGERINAPALDEDLAWLNRTPYRSVSGVFAPGDEVGLSTLNLQVTEQKPWQVFAGWSNTGTHATGFDRSFAGFGAALPMLRDSYMSYQLTGSWNFWRDPTSVGSGPDQPNYYSQAGRLVLGVGDRQSLEIVPSYVATRQTGAEASFTYDNSTLEVPVLYRTAISNFLPGTYWGDLILGANFKTVSRTSYFAESDVGGADAGLFNLIAGWSMSRPDAFGLTNLELRLVGNPGGVVDGNTAQSWSQYSAGRITDVNYVYGGVDISRVTRLTAGYSWNSQFSGILAGDALPDTEQLSLGGIYATRGYTLDDGNVDTGFFWRNELRTPTLPVLSSLGVAGVHDQLSPFLFVDVGWGHNYGYPSVLGPVSSSNVSMVGVGGGADYAFAGNLTASLVTGVALTDAGHTQAGDVSVQTRLYVSF